MLCHSNSKTRRTEELSSFFVMLYHAKKTGCRRLHSKVFLFFGHFFHEKKVRPFYLLFTCYFFREDDLCRICVNREPALIESPSTLVNTTSKPANTNLQTNMAKFNNQSIANLLGNTSHLTGRKTKITKDEERPTQVMSSGRSLALPLILQQGMSMSYDFALYMLCVVG